MVYVFDRRNYTQLPRAQRDAIWGAAISMWQEDRAQEVDEFVASSEEFLDFVYQLARLLRLRNGWFDFGRTDDLEFVPPNTPEIEDVVRRDHE